MVAVLTGTSIRRRESTTARPRVPCRPLVCSKRQRKQPAACAMRRSTRADAVVQASTQANMLTNAPRSMATPSGETPALPARMCKRAGGLAQLSWISRRESPELQEYEQSMKKAPGQKRALEHGARNGTQGIARFDAQSRRAFEPHEAEDGQHQSRAQRRNVRALERELIAVELQSEMKHAARSGR